MRVNTIRNYSAGVIAPKNLKVTKTRQELPVQTLNHDTVSFKSRASVGVGLGALFGSGLLATMTLFTGGVAAPAAFGVYSAVFGTTGGLLGNALDKTADRRTEYE